MGAGKSKQSYITPTSSSSSSTNQITRPQAQHYHEQARPTPTYQPQPQHASYGYTHESDGEIHKGLHNELSAFHCFINVIIQSLWHLNSFRSRFEALDFNHVHHCEPCIFCALRTIFVAFEYSDSTIIPPDHLRQALNDGDLRLARDRFRIGSMGDAEEALDFILRWLHSEQVTRENEDVSDDDFHADVPCTPSCISHSVFAGQYMDCRVCRDCGGVSEPDNLMNSFLYRVYAGEILAQFDESAIDSSLPSFEDRLRRTYQATQYSCPNSSESGCKGAAFIDRWMLQVPLVFAVMFVWPHDVDRQDISLIWSILPHELSLNSLMRTHCPDLQPYVMRGIVGFYGQHYMAFFWSVSHNTWLMFDDRRVVRVGDWYDLCQKVTVGKIRPILVFFETADDIGSSTDRRSLAASMATERVRTSHTNITASSTSSFDNMPHVTAPPQLVVDDVSSDLDTLDYATPRETQTQIARTSRR